MPIIEWAFVCDSAFVDASGKASIIGAFENLTAHALPFSHPQMSIAVGLKLALEEEVEVNTVIITAHGKEIARTNPKRLTRADTEGASTLIVIFTYHGTTFSEIGQHHIEILLDGNTARFIPLIIGLLPKE
jgi:hypothetical protein